MRVWEIRGIKPGDRDPSLLGRINQGSRTDEEMEDVMIDEINNRRSEGVTSVGYSTRLVSVFSNEEKDRGVISSQNAIQLARLPMEKRNDIMITLSIAIHPKLFEGLIDLILGE